MLTSIYPPPPSPFALVVLLSTSLLSRAEESVSLLLLLAFALPCSSPSLPSLVPHHQPISLSLSLSLSLPLTSCCCWNTIIFLDYFCIQSTGVVDWEAGAAYSSSPPTFLLWVLMRERKRVSSMSHVHAG